MPYYRIGGVVAHIRMSPGRGKKAAPPCPFWLRAPGKAGEQGERIRCMGITTVLCDWPGCNAPMCAAHALSVGPDLDVCPTHNHQRGLFSRLLPAPQGETA